MDELLAEFIAETRETLAPLAGELVAWEAAPADRARLDAIFRFVHTVKGSCGFLDLPRLERLSHAAESALANVRGGSRPADAALVTAVLAMLDRIGAMVDALEAGEAYPDGGDEALILALEGRDPVRQVVPTAAPPAAPRAAARSVRLPVDLLDRMMAGVSDLVLARNELGRRLRDGGDGMAAFDRLSGCIAAMREAITRTRMQRIENLFAALPRMVRDLSQELGKPVALHVDGADVELDREMIEMIRDPLTHIVRNAIDHGLETAAVRRAAGKPETGSLRVAARQAGNQILLEIADDGRGVDADRLVDRAVAAGLLDPAAAAALPRAARLQLMFAPGLSTAGTVSAISGRGVGMDIVRANVERIGGVVEVDSDPGLGTRLTLRVPLTLTIIPALTLSAGGQGFALPRAAIEEILRIGPRGAAIERVGDGEVALVRGRRVPLARLDGLLGLDVRGPALAVLLRPAGGQAAFALGVDAVHDHEELVIKPAAPAIMATGLYAGITLPDSGRPMLLLDPAGLADAAGVGRAGDAAQPVLAADAAQPGVATLLFLDLDGVERAVRLAAVERIEEVPADAVRHSAGRLRLTRGDRVLPVLAQGQVPTAGRARVLMMGDAGAEFAYAIDRVLDIAELAGEVAPAAVPGAVAGVLLVDGRQVELLDPWWLVEAAAARPPATAARPLCLLAGGGDGWSRDVLRPLLETVGYRVAFANEGEPPAVVLTLDDAASPDGVTAPVVRLRSARGARGPGDTSIYRYDRDDLLGALRRHLA